MSSRTMLLSRHGSGRASAYAEANKIVTFQHKTHVAWLDSVTDGFCVRILWIASRISGRKCIPLVWHTTITEVPR